MESGVTPSVWSTIAKYGIINHSFEIAKQTLNDWGVKISVKRISSLTYRLGAEGLSIRNSKILALERDLLSTNSQLKDKRVVISVDGGRTRIRTYQSNKINLKTKRKKYTGEWIEPKLLTIYTVDERGKQYRKSARGQKREILSSQINYFSKREVKGLLNYDKIVQLKLPIGSGAVESLIRQARDLRLKGNGKFWLKENAEIILHSRCQWLSNSWDNFTNSILTLRIYPAIS